MVVRRSAGVLVYRRGAGGIEVLLAHMGGPFWAKKDAAAWSLPKGEIEEGEAAEVAARREFAEELGVSVPPGEWVALGEIRQSGKVVTAWAVEGELDPEAVVPGVFEMEWPPRSGVLREFPEVDRVEWFSLEVAREKLVKGQRGFVDRLAEW